TLALAHHSNTVYFLRDNALFAVDLVQAFHGQGGERRIGKLEQCGAYDGVTGLAGGISVDADESFVYAGVSYGEDAGGILALDTGTGQGHRVVRTPFKVGHVQANPQVSGRI